MISRSGTHAIHALALLGELPAGEYAGAASIARAIGAPENYLGKLLQAMTSDGLVESRKGAGGGFRLGRPAEQIGLYDAVDAIDHLSRWKQCVLGYPRCSDDNPCALHEPWAETRDRYLEMLRTTTIADIIRARPKGDRSPRKRR